jgi:exopolysaccharide production protein ExoZ
MTENKIKNVVTVQWLRGIAAMMVVIHHARNPTPWLFNPLEHYEAFAWGVDIFFVISGFIMYIAARDEKPAEFIMRRVIRVVPLYWMATIGLYLINSRHHLFQLSETELDHLIRSLLFIPHYSPSRPDQIWPYLVPGWTLNFEMFFYLVFFVALIVKRLLLVITVIIPFLIGIGLLLPNDIEPIFKTYSNPIMLEFVTGVWIGKLFSSKSLPSATMLLLPFGFLGLFVLPFMGSELIETLGRLACSTMILTGTLSIANIAPSIFLLKKIGDASYSIYLSHLIIGMPISNKIVSRIAIEGYIQFLLWVTIYLIVSVLIGLLIHALVEKPMINLLNKKAKEVQLINKVV